MGKNFNFFSVAFLVLLIFNCGKNGRKNDDSFILIKRGSYEINSLNGYNIYTKDKKIMDGYYVVGNELSKWEEFEVNNGILNGDYIIFHANGEIFSHTIYKNGKKNGEEKMYYPSGKLKSVSTYSNDILYGTSKTYFESGQLQSLSKIENGKPLTSETYDIIGNIVSQTFVKDGRTISQHINNGKVVFENISSNYDNFEAVRFFNDDGSLKIYLRMLTEGDNAYIIELDENENEIKRINVKANPQKVLEYQKYFMSM